jgi:protein SCO1/2
MKPDHKNHKNDQEGTKSNFRPFPFVPFESSCVLFVAFLLFVGQNTWAAAQQTGPSVLQNVGIEQSLGKQLDLNLRFRDESGNVTALSKYFDGKPVILAPVYFMCSSLCPMSMNSLVQALRVLKFNAGSDFTVIAFSFDPKETPAMAADAKAHYVKDYDRPGTGNGFHFLTGDEDSIHSQTQAIGFHYAWDGTQWAHATGIMVATPEGKLAQYFYGLEYSARDLRLSLVQASNEKIGSIADKVLLYCYRYDPATGKYGMVVIRTVRIFGAATALTLFGFMFVMFRRDAKAGRI